MRESSDDQIDGQTDSPCVLQDFLSFKAAAQKPESGLKTFLMSLLSKGVNPRVTVRNDITSYSSIPLSSANQWRREKQLKKIVKKMIHFRNTTPIGFTLTIELLFPLHNIGYSASWSMGKSRVTWANWAGEDKPTSRKRPALTNRPTEWPN